MRIFLASLLALIFTSAASAALLGKVHAVRNLPGYIEANPESSFYRGVIQEKDLNDQIERRSPSQIIVDLFDGDFLSREKLNQFLGTLTGYHQNLYRLECLEVLGKTDLQICDHDPKFQAKWKSESIQVALGVAEKNISSVIRQALNIKLSKINSEENQERIEKIYSSYQIWESVKAEDRQLSNGSPILRGVKKVLSVFEKTYIEANRPEAANLLVPKGHPLFGKQMFLSEKDLSALASQGKDLSLLNPPSTGLWRRPEKNIADYNTDNYDSSGLQQLKAFYSDEEVEKIINPDQEISVIYKKQHLSGGFSPKFDIQYGKGSFKMKFLTDRHSYPGERNTIAELAKLVNGSEANVEPVANNLAAALGFTVDPTYFKKRVRVYFEDEVYEKGDFEHARVEMINEISKRYPGQINISSALQVVKTDEIGKKYIEMKTLSLEQKSNSKTDFNIGEFHRAHLGKDLAREHRGFFLFLAWIADPDVKNDNDKLKLVPDGDSYKVMESNSDMGAAFGLGYPNIYNFHLIKSVRKDPQGNPTEIKFNYPRIFEYPLQQAVNMNDAKWFARLLGQLSLPQIESAFTYGGYPAVVAKYYALLAARRRNELLNALSLMGTEFTNDQGVRIKLMPLPEFAGTVPGFESYFQNGLLTDPANTLQNSELENWPRDWGLSRRVLREDPRIRKELGKVAKGDFITTALTASALITNEAMIHRQGGVELGFNRVFQNSMVESGLGGNYIADGIDFGIRNFVPNRVLIMNPRVKTDPLHPYWMVDTLRIGFFVGDYNEVLKDFLDFGGIASARAGAGARVFKILEILKITPVTGSQDTITHSKNFLELPKYALPGLREKIVSELKENETLIATSYYGGELMARLKGVNFPLIFSGLRLSANVKVGNRVTLHKSAKQFLINFAHEVSTDRSVTLNAVDLFVKVPIFSAEYKNSKKIEKDFVFDDSTEDLGILNQNLRSPAPESIPEKYRLSERANRFAEHSASASLLWLSGPKNRVKKLQTDFMDFEKTLQSHTRVYTLSQEGSRKRDIEKAVWEKSAAVLVNASGKLGLSLEFKINYPGATKDRFFPVLNQYRSFFPKDLFIYNEEYVKHYMGEVKGRGKLIFTSSQLSRIFSQNLNSAEVCEWIPAVSFDVCKQNFYPAYLIAKNDYQTLNQFGYQSRDRLLKNFARFFLYQDTAVEFAKAFIGEKDVIQHGSLESSLEAFPGQNGTLDVASNLDELKGFNEGLGFKPELFSDDIHQAVAGLFFAPLTPNGVVKKNTRARERESLSD